MKSYDGSAPSSWLFEHPDLALSRRRRKDVFLLYNYFMIETLFWRNLKPSRSYLFIFLSASFYHPPFDDETSLKLIFVDEDFCCVGILTAWENWCLAAIVVIILMWMGNYRPKVFPKKISTFFSSRLQNSNFIFNLLAHKARWRKYFNLKNKTSYFPCCLT